MQQTVSTRFGVWFTVLLVSLGLLWAPSTAHAHDVLVESTPEVGSTTETTPTEVRLRFSGTPLTGEGLTNLIRVSDEDGNQWHDGDVQVEGYELAVPLCEGLPQGEYTVAYRVVYSDGHTGEEQFSFSNADPDAPESGNPEDCGEVADTPAPTTSETADTSDTADTNEAQDASNAEDQAAENSSTSIPTWVWIVGIVGILIIAAVVFWLLGGRRTGPDSANPGDD